MNAAMESRILGRTGRSVSVVGQGCWQLGSDWGSVSPQAALEVLQAALDAGVTFFDTADVYGDGRSEQFVAEIYRPDIFVATKTGRRADPHVAQAYTADNIRAWVDRSRRNLGMDTLDLVQLHCPPTEVLATDEIYDVMDDLVSRKAIAAYGVSVETCQEALMAMSHPHVASIQIILNAFRHKPLEEVLPTAVENGIGIIARVPLASGLLTGKYTKSSVFAPDDHRSFNRHGEAFDVGETFSGVPFTVGLQAAQQIKEIAADYASTNNIEATTAQFALRWILDRPGVTAVIPGARTAEQAQANADAGRLPPLSDTHTQAVADVYDSLIREHVHSRW